MSVIQNIKAAWNRYLERLAKENQELFRDGRPDCCTMNRQRPAPKTDGREKR